MVTPQQFNHFATFALERITEGRAESLGQLVHEWESQREFEEAVADIRAGMEDIEAGRCMPLDQAIDEIREKLALN